MNKINIKKNVLIVFFSIIVFIFGIIFLIINRNKNTKFFINNNDETSKIFSNINLNNENKEDGVNIENSENKENAQVDNYIYVHIIGEVNNAGIVKLIERSKNN